LIYIDIYIQISGELTFENFYQRREVPPPTGYGSDADSLQSIYNLIPKAPRRDEGKLMDLQVEYESVVYFKVLYHTYKGLCLKCKALRFIILKAPRRDEGKLMYLQVDYESVVYFKGLFFIIHIMVCVLDAKLLRFIVLKAPRRDEGKLMDLQVEYESVVYFKVLYYTYNGLCFRCKAFTIYHFQGAAARRGQAHRSAGRL